MSRPARNGSGRPRAILRVSLGLLLSAPVPHLHAQGVEGRVVDEDAGTSVHGAQVVLVDSVGGGVRAVLTDSAGGFAIPVARPGFYTLRVEHVAYETATTAPIHLLRDEVVDVELRVSQTRIVLDPLVVTARRGAGNAHLREFYERAERNRATGKGLILTRVQLAALDGMTAGNVLARQHVTFRRIHPLRPCMIQTYWNGMLIEEVTDEQWRASMQAPGGFRTAGRALWSLPVSTVEGMEVYDEMDELPDPYFDHDVCGVILVWSRPQRPGDGDGGPWLTRALIGVGAFLVILFITGTV